MEWKLICKLSSISWKSNYFCSDLSVTRPHFQQFALIFSLFTNNNVLLSRVSVFNNELELCTAVHTERNEIITLAFKNHSRNYKNICCRLIVLHKPLKFIKNRAPPSIHPLVFVWVCLWNGMIMRKSSPYIHMEFICVSVNLLARTILSTPGHTKTHWAKLCVLCKTKKNFNTKRFSAIHPICRILAEISEMRL